MIVEARLFRFLAVVDVAQVDQDLAAHRGGDPVEIEGTVHFRYLLDGPDRFCSAPSPSLDEHARDLAAVLDGRDPIRIAARD